MNRFSRLFISENKRWRFMNRFSVKLVLGCLGLIFIVLCFGTLLVIYFFPVQ